MDSPKDYESKSPSFLGRLRGFLSSKKTISNENSSEEAEKLTSDAEITMNFDSSETTEEGSTGEQASGITFTDNKAKNRLKSSSINKVTDKPMPGKNEKDKDCDDKTYYSDSDGAGAHEWTSLLDSSEESYVEYDDDGFRIYQYEYDIQNQKKKYYELLKKAQKGDGKKDEVKEIDLDNILMQAVKD